MVQIPPAGLAALSGQGEDLLVTGRIVRADGGTGRNSTRLKGPAAAGHPSRQMDSETALIEGDL